MRVVKQWWSNRGVCSVVALVWLLCCTWHIKLESCGHCPRRAITNTGTDTRKVDLWINRRLGGFTWEVWGVTGWRVNLKRETWEFHLCTKLIQEEWILHLLSITHHKKDGIGTSLMVQWLRIHPAVRGTCVLSGWGAKIPYASEQLNPYTSLVTQLGNNPPCNAGDLGLIPGLGRPPKERNSYLFQYSCLENSMDCIVSGVSKSRAQRSYFPQLESLCAATKDFACHN